MLKPTPSKPGLFSVAFKRLCALKSIAVVALASLVLSVLYLVSITPLTAVAATNNTINFQARLEDASGAIVPDGNYNVEFKLYNVSSAGTAEWTEDYLNSASQGVHVANGYLTVNLGSITPFPSTIDWDQQQWMTMNIGGTTTGSVTWDGEMNPRLQMTAVPYALRAGSLASPVNTSGYQSTLSMLQPANSVTGNEVFQIPDMGAAGTYTLMTTATGVQLQPSTPGTAQTGNFNISGTGIVNTLNATSININTTSPQGVLTVKGTTSDSTALGLVVNDANGDNLLQVRNDGQITLGRASGTNSTIGKTNIGTHPDSGYSNLVSADKITTGPVNATLSSITTYVGSPIDTTHDNYYVGIYSDNSGTPGTLLATSAQGTLTAGAWNTLPVSASLSANTSYWLAFFTNTTVGADPYQYYDTTATVNHAYMTGVSYTGGLPSTFTATGTSTAMHSIYASVSETGSLGATLTINPTTGATLMTPTNTTTAFQVQNSSSSPILVTDTTNGRVGIDGSSPTATLQVKNSSSNATILDVQNSSSFDTLTIADTGKVSLGKAPAAALGNGVIGTGGGSDYGLLTGQKFTTGISGGGAISSMSVYIHSGVSASPNNLGQLAIYADTTSGCALSAADCPSTLIASSSQTALNANSWNTMNVSATLSASTTYWLVFWENDPTQSDEALVTPTNAGTPFVFGSATWGASMPSTFPAMTFDNTGYDASIYASYASNGSALIADTASNTIQLGYNTTLALQGSSAYIQNSQGFTGSESLGLSASVSDAKALALGDTSNSAYEGTAVGYSASAYQSGTAIGYGAWTSGAGAVALGWGANANTNGTALGVSAVASADSIAIGTQAATTASNQLVIGSAHSSGFYVQDAYLGSGVTDSAPQSVTLHATGGSGSNVAGANLNLASGIGTGSGNGGNITFQIATPSSSGSSANSLSTVATISGADGTVSYKNATNSATAFQIQNSSGAQVLDINTIGNSVVLPSANLVTSFGGFGNYSNLLLDSEAFNQAAWVTGGSMNAPLDNSVTAPNGTTTGSTLTSTGSSNYLRQQVAVTASTTYTFSWWAKAGTMTPVNYSVFDSTHSTDIIPTTVYAVGAGWQRFSATFTTPAGCTSILVYPMRDSGGTSTGTVNLWGAQLVQGSSTGTYVATTTSSQSSASDGLTVDGNALIENQANSNTAFQVQNASSKAILDVDTANNRVGIGTATPSSIFDVETNTNTVTAPQITLNQAGTGDASIALQSAAQPWYIGVSSANSSNFVITSANADKSSSTFGNTTAESNPDNSGSGYQVCSQYTPGGSGSEFVSSISAYVGSAADVAPNNLYQVAIYTDSSGPSTLVAHSASAAVTGNSWNTVTVNATITGGTPYWLCYQKNASSGSLSEITRNLSGTGAYNTAGSQTFGTWSATFPAHSSDFDGYAIYATYSQNGTYNTFGTNLMSLSTIGQATFQNSTNSTSAFQVQNASGVSLFGVNTSGSTVNIGSVGSTVLASAVNIATSTGAAQTVTLGSTNGASSTTIQGGSGGIVIGSSSTANSVVTQAQGITNTMTGSATNPSVVIQTSTNSTNAFQIVGSSNRVLLNADTTDGQIALIGNQNTYPTLLVEESPTCHVGNYCNASLFSLQDASGNKLVNVSNSGDLTIGNPTVNNSGAGRIFSDGFESGNLSLWNGGVTGSVSASTTNARTGIYAAKVTNSSVSYATENIPTQTTTVMARAYVYINGTSSTAQLFSFSDGTNHYGVYFTGSGLSFYNNGTLTSSGLGYNTAHWHEIELDITPGAGTGSATIYVDGAAATTPATGQTINNLTQFIIGDTAGTDTGASYIDDVSVDTVQTGQSDDVSLSDSLHVSGTSSFGSEVLVQPAANTTKALQVENSSGANLFTVDTTNTALVLGNDGTPAALTVRGGAASGDNANGANITFQASNGTGAGGSGSFMFQTGKPSGGGVGVDNSGTTSIGSGTTVTLSYTDGSNANRLLMVQMETASSRSFTSVTYNGVALTHLTSRTSGSVHTELWYLVNPASGTNNIVATESSSGPATLAAASFYNVNQTTPMGTSAQASGTTSGTQSTSMSVTTTSAAQLVFNAIGIDTGSASLANGSGGQTQLWNYVPGGGIFVTGGGYQQADNSGTTNVSWNVTSADWADIGVPINPTTNTTSDSLSTALDIANTGNIGVGNTNPQYSLDVAGTGRIQSTTNSTTAFQTQNASAATVFDVDTTNKQVGINTNAPAATLDIQSPATTSNIVNVNASSLTTGSALNISTGAANSLTTGNLVNIATASNVQSSGSLLNVSDTATLGTSGSSINGSLINVSRSLTANISGSSTGTPTLDHGSTFATYPAATSQTDSFTVNSGHSNYYMVIGVFDDLGQPAPTVTYAGATASLLSSGGIGNGSTGVYLYGLKAPATGTNNLVVNGNSGEWSVAVEDYYNVNQTTPTGTMPTQTKGTSSPASITVTTVSGDTVTDFLAETTPSVTPASGQTQADYSGNLTMTYGPGTVSQSYKVASGASTTMQWNSPTWWGMAAVDLKGASISAASVTSSVAAISNSCTITAGSCTDSTNVLSLNQSYSGATGTVLSIQNSGSGDELDLLSGSSTVMKVSSNGDTTFETGTNSSTAFRVQNAGGTNMFLIDSTNNVITIGSGSTNIVLYGTVTSGTISAIQPGTSTTPETWHNFGTPSGWTDDESGHGFRYRMMPDGTVEIYVHLTAPTTAPGGGTVIGTLPSGYIPTYGQNLPVASTSNTASGTQTPHIWIPAGSGNVTVYGIAASAIIGGTLVVELN